MIKEKWKSTTFKNEADLMTQDAFKLAVYAKAMKIHSEKPNSTTMLL